MSNRSDRRRSQPIFSRLSRHAASLFTDDAGRILPPTQPSLQRSLSNDEQEEMSLSGMRRFESRRAIEEAQFLPARIRAADLNPPVDFRLLDYVESCDSNLTCAICRCPFVDPVALTCDHCFCRECIQQSWSSQYHPGGPRGPCPSCRTPGRLGPKSATTKILANIVDDLLVKCPKHEAGCTIQVKRGEIQDHVNIYCGYTLVECSATECVRGMRRKDLSQGCLHYGVSCLDCHEEVLKSSLDSHWESECPDRKVNCDLCNTQIFYRQLSEHNHESCPAMHIPCPGKALGCGNVGARPQAEAHASTCTFAILAPILSAQQQRMTEQETAQKLMSRKLEILETGFTAMQGLLSPRRRSESESLSEDEGHRSLHQNSFVSVGNRSYNHAASLPSPFRSTTGDHLFLQPQPPIIDFDDPSVMIGSSNETEPGPYTSPLHHLLSMHESLREELARVSTALSDLDARHSMQTLNENLRTREEVTYLGAQVAGLGRQVHWLTSAQLQRTQQPPRDSASSSASEVAEAAVSAVESAVRSAARVVSAGQTLRRGNSEEGRTKL